MMKRGTILNWTLHLILANHQDSIEAQIVQAIVYSMAKLLKQALKALETTIKVLVSRPSPALESPHHIRIQRVCHGDHTFRNLGSTAS